MTALKQLIISHSKTPQFWIKNIIWRLPKGVSDLELIFVIGTPRSGTTLLQKILEGHSKLFSIQAETGIFSWQNYFDPEKEHFLLRKDEIKYLLQKSKSNIDFFQNGVRLLMDKNPGKIFVEKTPQHVIHLDFLIKRFPNAKFIHIVRDGRDCYCSAKSHPWIPQSKSIKKFAKYYKECLNPVIRNKKNQRIMTIHYEDLVAKPVNTIERTMKFLEKPFEVAQLNSTNIKNDKRARLQQFDKLNGPVDNKSVGRWRKELSIKENKIFLGIATKQLEYFNFPLD